MLSELIHKHSPDTLYIESDRHKFRADAKNLFFYHLNRTGGLTFFNPIVIACNFTNQLLARTGRNQPIKTARVDETGPSLSNLLAHDFRFISGHVEFGFHKHLKTASSLATIVRQPVARVTSEYTRDCMRTGQNPREEEFVEYFRNKTNQNRMCKLLHPQAYNPSIVKPDENTYQAQNRGLEDSLAVIQNLKENFDHYILNEEIPSLL